MKALFIFVLTLLVASAVDIVPRFMPLMPGSELHLDSSLRNYRIDCDQPPKDRMACTDTFVIDAAKLAGASAGLGIFISATEIYCGGNASNKLRFGDTADPSLALELLKTYQTIDLKLLRCKETLRIDVWGPSEYRRSGLIGGHWFTETPLGFTRLKK